MIIAIDGPAASGKGTLARRIAGAYSLVHLDTGLLYRAVAKALIDASQDPTDEPAAVAAARSLSLANLKSAELRSEAIGEAASKVAAIAAVRTELTALQRRFANEPANGAAGAILDGRDIGTVICPDADIKFYVTASIETRAQRRYAELRARDEAVTLEAVIEDLRQRDARDSERAVSPLKPAADAHLLDTTNLSIDSAFAKAKALISKHLG